MNGPALRSLLLAAFRRWKPSTPPTEESTAGALLEQSSAGRPWLDLIPPEEDLGTRALPTWWGKVALLLEQATGEPCAGRFAGVEFGIGTVRVTLTPDDLQAPVAIRAARLSRVGSTYVVEVELAMERGGIDSDAETAAAFYKSLGRSPT